MPPVHGFDLDDAALPASTSLEACDEATTALATERAQQTGTLLGQFATLMAEHSRGVEPELMQTDREYALWQLACAHSIGDPVLKQLAVRLFGMVDRAFEPGP
ncbi:hypothetical protein [Ramlibacter rhizophilus]|uniref:Uncharacterized protein n=1 Tax=Ramlibacter rhizophilus TaxID=1781167 RepID=A0A4Z0BSZ8_9BURK|nr:hypothetical protein [Ramlibacter rhizophilus]TFZ01378.1 hypothetical protein EZ242_08340 [Ramlibacter rhizophilus]